MKLLILQGLPASGKSTYAKDLVKKGNWKRVNKDDLRDMMDNYVWSPENEKFVNEIRNKIILAALRDGVNVVVDDTNLNPKHEHDIRMLIATSSDIRIASTEIDTKFFDVSIEECVRRDYERKTHMVPKGRSVGKHVIEKMYNQLENGKPRKDEYPIFQPEPYTHTPGLPECVVFDIDGTLAHMTTREGSPFAWERVGEDAVDPLVRDELILHNDAFVSDFGANERRRGAMPGGGRHTDQTYIIVLSGRDGVCRPGTEQWLKDQKIPYDHLFMRAEGDSRKDYIIKYELFEKHIRGKFNVRVIYDDRDQVVRMWRKMGIKVFQVAEGDF